MESKKTPLGGSGFLIFSLNNDAKKFGQIVDGLFANPRRLAISHFCLALALAFIYWIRPGAFTPYRRAAIFTDITPIYATFIAWFPYLLSFLAARALLAGRNQIATLVFIAFATTITIGAAGFYLNAFGMQKAPAPIIVSAGLTFGLITSSALCSTIGRRYS
jgi:hypothetical protein